VSCCIPVSASLALVTTKTVFSAAMGTCVLHVAMCATMDTCFGSSGQSASMLLLNHPITDPGPKTANYPHIL